MSEQTLQVTPFKEWCDTRGVTSVFPKVRVNQNGYPFCTVLMGSEAENIYFSKSAAENLIEDDIISNPLGLKVVETLNSEGEQRLKLTWSSGDYISVAEFFS